MEADRWRRLNELFHATLAREPDRRDEFLDGACPDDAALRDEVRSLLRAHAVASVLDQPAVAADSGLLPSAADDPLIGERLGPYEVASLLGRGGMGIVYLALDTRLQRPVAIKALPPAYTQDTGLRARLRREARAAAALSHPGIATVFALEEFDQRLYLVCEYVAGRTLGALMEVRAGAISITEVLSIAVDVARALGAAHAHGVIHRDLKPENVMQTPGGGIKVVDFGLARFEQGDGPAAGERLTRPGGIPGTPGYLAPEVLRGDPADARADQFSFGVILYELVTGRHPFRGADGAATVTRILETEPPAIEPSRPDCPQALARIIMTCLAKEPRNRYPVTDTLAADLEAARGAGLSPGEPVAVRASASRPTSGPDNRAENRVENRPAAAPLWWWQFHQVAVSVLYGLTLYPLWLARGSIPGGWGLATFVTAVGIVGVAANLRLHLWFTSQVYPAELAEQRRRSSAWKRLADAAFAGLLLAVGAALAPGHALWAAFFITMAISSAAIAIVMEPATTRAAFPHR